MISGVISVTSIGFAPSVFEDFLNRSEPRELVAHHPRGRHDRREGELEHRLGPVPAALDCLGGVHANVLVVRQRARAKKRVS